MTKSVHASMTLAQLQNAHSEMLATASDLGFDPPAEFLDLFETEVAGVPICNGLHEAITKFRESLTPQDNIKRQRARREAAQKTVATDASSEQTANLPDTAKGRKLKKAANEAAKPATGNVGAKPKKENTVAKKAKKVPAKKAAKKAAAPAAPRAKFDDNAKITWLLAADKGSGCREGTGKHDRHDIVRKHNGKTVKTYLAAKGSGGVATLAACVKLKKAKVAA